MSQRSSEPDAAAQTSTLTGAAGWTDAQRDLLAQWAARYIWWKTPAEALRFPQRVLAQVMNLGDYDDLLALLALFDQETLRDTLRHAEAGQFNARSWHYWHYKLKLAELGQVPSLPVRRF